MNTPLTIDDILRFGTETKKNWRLVLIARLEYPPKNGGSMPVIEFLAKESNADLTNRVEKYALSWHSNDEWRGREYLIDVVTELPRLQLKDFENRFCPIDSTQKEVARALYDMLYARISYLREFHHSVSFHCQERILFDQGLLLVDSTKSDTTFPKTMIFPKENARSAKEKLLAESRDDFKTVY